MANAAQIADLLTQGMQGPQGPEDAAFHTGVIKSWDRQTGINVVTINGVDIPNVKALQGGIPAWFVAGDVVVVIRKQTQYFVMGKVAAPGGAAGSGVGFNSSNFITWFDTGGAWADNPSFPNTPRVTVYIGTSRTALILWSCDIDVIAGDPAVAHAHDYWCHGEVGWAISGASTVAPGAFNSTTIINHHGFWPWTAGQSSESIVTVSGTYTAGPSLLNTGLTTFTMKYKSLNGDAQFSNPSLTVIPL